VIGAILVAPVYRDLALRDPSARGWGTLPLGSLDTLGMGALLAIAFRDAASPRTVQVLLGRVFGPLGLLSFLALHAYAASTGHMRGVVAFHEISYALICCWLIAGAYRGFDGPAGELLCARPLVYLGKISYGIYAYHMLMPWVLGRTFARMGWPFPDPGPTRLLVAGAVTVVVAMVSWHFFERPINSLKRHVPYIGPARSELAAARAVPMESGTA
jgi:peptidoglycan/LPS O-acetylase OafA/YrhL